MTALTNPFEDTFEEPIAREGLSVVARGLVHIYRTEGHDVAALSGIDLVVAPGEMLALLGPSGSGKSTLLTLCGGLMRPSAGRLSVGEHELSTMAPDDLDRLRACDVGLMLQGAGRNLIPYLSPRGNVEFAQSAARKAGKSVPHAAEILHQVDLTEHADARLSDLTPGHLQLTALAVAIAADPGLLLADEPTSQLHHDARGLVLDTIARINAERGTTIVLVTHDAEVADVIPRTITIRDGRIGAEGRGGEEFAVVGPDGTLPLPPHVLADLAPGSLVRVRSGDDGWVLVREERDRNA